MRTKGEVSRTTPPRFNASQGTKTSPGTLDFTAGHLAGAGTFTGTVGGVAVSRSGSLADLGLANTFSLSGNADFTCGGSPALALTFPAVSVTLQFDRL